MPGSSLYPELGQIRELIRQANASNFARFRKLRFGFTLGPGWLTMVFPQQAVRALGNDHPPCRLHLDVRWRVDPRRISQ